jgi:hypothetical protein
MAEIQMSPHVQAAYKDAVDNVIFHKMGSDQLCPTHIRNHFCDLSEFL